MTKYAMVYIISRYYGKRARRHGNAANCRPKVGRTLAVDKEKRLAS